jgi:hypothetical protein
MWITLFLFKLYNGKLIQKATYLEKNFQGIEKEYKDKFIAIYFKKIIGLHRHIKELEQNSKNTTCYYKIYSKNNSLD